MKLADFSDYFTVRPWRRIQSEPPLTDQDVDAASADLAFSHMAAYTRLMEWLEREADRQVQPKAEMHDMISGITRQNTMKEVRDHLRKQTQQAQEVMARHREGLNG